MKLVLLQLLTDCSDLLSELIFHSGVGKILQSGVKCLSIQNENNMVYCDYIWDSLSLVAGAISILYSQERKTIDKPFTSFFFVYWMSHGDISGDGYAYW